MSRDKVCGAPKDGRDRYPVCGCETEADCEYGTQPQAASSTQAEYAEVIACELEGYGSMNRGPVKVMCDRAAAMIRRLASSTTPGSSVSAWVAEMKTSAGTDYFVCVGRDTGNALDRTYMTPQKYRIRGRAEYDVACWNHMLNGGSEPDILAFDTESVEAFAQPAQQGERGEG